jgi:hypothetical protein
MGFKRAIADFVEQVIGARIVRPDDIPLLLENELVRRLPNNIPMLLEKEHLRRFFDYFKIDCVFDVGANVGQYAKMVRSFADYNGPIVSFEPNPQIAAILREAAQRDGGWFVEEVALGASPGAWTRHIQYHDRE